MGGYLGVDLDGGDSVCSEPMSQQRGIPTCARPDLAHSLAAMDVQVLQHRGNNARHARRTGREVSSIAGPHGKAVIDLSDHRILTGGQFPPPDRSVGPAQWPHHIANLMPDNVGDELL